jgi:hypothetical protein
LANVNLKICPCIRSPESNTPVSEVAVCVTWRLSMFSQHTVLPAGISTVGGWNVNSEIATIVSLSSHEPDGSWDTAPADTPACGISSAPKLSATMAATSELRRK